MKKIVNIQDISKLVSVTDLELSPDSNDIVFVSTTIDEKENVYKDTLYHINLETREHRQWTPGKGRISSPKWSADGSAVAYLGEQNGYNHLFVLSVAEKQIIPVTNSDTSIERFEWSACGTKIWISGILEKELTSTSVYKQIGFLNMESKKIEQVLVGDFQYRLEAISHNGAKIVYGITKETNHEFVSGQPLYIYDIETKQQTMLTENQGHFSGVAFSQDDSKIAYIGNMRQYGDATHKELYIADLQTQTNFCLTEGLDAPVGDYAVRDFQNTTSTVPVWTKDDHLYFQVSTMGDVRLYFASLDGMIFPASPEMEHIVDFDISYDGEYAILAISRMTQPVELYLLKITTGDYEALTSFNQEYVDETVLTEGQPMVTGSSIESVHSWLIAPIDIQEGEKYPLIVKVCDSPHRMFANSFSHELQLLAAQGYGVLTINPSGSHGYNQEFAKAGSEFAYKDMMTVVAEVVETIEWIDDSRLAVIGDSYAGLLTKLLFLDTKNGDRSTNEHTDQLELKLESMEEDTKFVRLTKASLNHLNVYKPSYRVGRLEKVMNWLEKCV